MSEFNFAAEAVLQWHNPETTISPTSLNRRPIDKTMRVLNAASVLVVACIAGCSTPPLALNYVAYYQIGLNDSTGVPWNTYVIDASSVRPEGSYIRYRSFRITPSGTDSVQEVRADCESGKRGPATGTDMYSTFARTLSGEEVKAACAIFGKKANT